VRKETDEDWVRREASRCQVELAAFELARFPTTHAMFERFLAAGDYAAVGWWEEAIAASYWRNGKAGERDRPAYWDDSRFSGANQPVVGVTWYEAVAYCRWLTATLNDGCVYRLPTEAEWERAARGAEARVYPWGDTWLADHCNSDELRLERTTPVGVFPSGASSEGLLDLSGNAWEWCSDWYAQDAYPQRAGCITRNPTGPRSGDLKVLRGGSWYNNRNIVRCAYRIGSIPDRRLPGIGFRVARNSR
jgi:formylglycine-generating enzyme required for sulfatase activity